ncbi:MAG: hypothetical protein ACC742_14475 [Thermoanaerobaculales bacterium]
MIPDRGPARVFRNGDERAINEGFNRTFNQQRSLDEWSWKFASRPDGRLIVLAESDGEVAAHCAGWPFVFHLDGREWPALRIVDVYPDGGDRLAGTVAVFVEEFGRSGRFPLVVELSDPPARSMKMLVGAEDALPPQPVATLVRSGPAPRSARRLLYRAEPARDWEPRLDDLWRRARRSYPAAMVRDAECALQRFAGHPTVRYHRFVVMPRFQRRAVAWGAYRTDGGRCRWIDLLWDHAHPGALELLSHLSNRLARQAGAESEELWLGGDPAGRAHLEKVGFRLDDPPDPPAMAVRSFDPDLDLAALDGRLYLTMGDSDLF